MWYRDIQIARYITQSYFWMPRYIAQCHTNSTNPDFPPDRGGIYFVCNWYDNWDLKGDRCTFLLCLFNCVADFQLKAQCPYDLCLRCSLTEGKSKYTTAVVNVILHQILSKSLLFKQRNKINIIFVHISQLRFRLRFKLSSLSLFSWCPWDAYSTCASLRHFWTQTFSQHLLDILHR